MRIGELQDPCKVPRVTYVCMYLHMYLQTNSEISDRSLDTRSVSQLQVGEIVAGFDQRIFVPVKMCFDTKLLCFA